MSQKEFHLPLSLMCFFPSVVGTRHNAQMFQTNSNKFEKWIRYLPRRKLTLIHYKAREFVAPIAKPSTGREVQDTLAPAGRAGEREWAKGINPGPSEDDVVHHGVGRDEGVDLAVAPQRDSGAP